PPFQAESWLETLNQTLQQPPARPRLLNPNIHVDLETVCLKCLEKDPGKRYATAEMVAEELDRYLRGERIKTRPPSWRESVSGAFGRRREVLDPLSWSYIASLGGAVIFFVHTAIFWITQPEGPTDLFVPCICLSAVLTSLITWYYLLRRRHSFTPDEWHV